MRVMWNAVLFLLGVLCHCATAKPKIFEQRQGDSVVIIPPNCDRIVDRETGCITSPNWPRKSVDFTECQVKVRVASGKRILMTFNNFTLEGTNACDDGNNYVEIRDSQTNRHDRYCGTFHPFVWLSDSNEVTVIMDALSSKVFNRFNATYVTVDKALNYECNRVFIEDTGKYANRGRHSNSPVNPYSEGNKCEIVILAKPDKRVTVAFKDLNIQNCQWPLKIKDLLTGRTETICREHSKIAWTSESNAIVIHFHDNDERNIVDFKYEANERDANRSCSHLLLAFPPNGLELHTPNFPQPYPSNLDCISVLHTRLDHVITLNVSEFVMQPPRKTERGETCLNDFCQIRDLATNRFYHHCGSYHNFSWTSDSNEILITFKTDHLLDYTGVKLIAKSVPRIPPPDCMTITRRDDSSFILTSLNYPSDYPSDVSCTITLRESPDRYVVFNFEEFELESSEGCVADFIQFKSGTSGIFSDRICGLKLPFSVTSDSNEVSLEFKTNDKNQQIGFKAVCTLIQRPIRTPENTECSRHLTEKSGRIQLPVNPDWPPIEGSDCLIVIHADPDEKIRLKFVSFAVSDLDSDKDYVEIYDIVDGESRKGRYTGHLSPFSWTSFGNELAIFIRDENEISSVSFIVDYETIARPEKGCQLLLTERSGSISWPFSKQRDNSHCNVVIRSSPHEQILLTFHTLTMERGVCSEHSMTIQDVTTKRQDKFCSTLWEFSWLSESNEVSMDFRQNTKSVVKVKATYRFIPRPKVSVFNQFLTSGQGTISSLEHNRDDIIGKNCTIYVQIAPEHSILVTFTDFLIGEKQDRNRQTITCTDEQFLEIKDLTTGRTNVYCGEFDLFTWTSDQNLVAITFRINTFPTYNVFRASYLSLSRVEGCDHRIIQPTGIIKSPNFPLPYSTNAECRYIVHSEPGNLVSLNFTDFDVQPCEQDHVEVKDLGTGRVDSLCGLQLLFSWTSDANEVSVTLRSGRKSTGATGFKALFRHIQRPLVRDCYVRLYEVTDIEIPDFTVKDAKHVECFFYIYTNPSNRITLTVDEFDEVFNCSDSGIQVSDLATQRTDTYCAISHSFSWTADTNELRIRVFASKDKIPRMLAHWQLLTRSDRIPVLLDEESGEISVDGTNAYQLVIRTLPNYRLVLNYFHTIEEKHDCVDDGITMTDSTTRRSYIDCEFFNGWISWISDSNEVIVDILRDEHATKVEYTSVLKAPPSECNKVLVSGINDNDLETTNYPAIYRNDDECDMIIQAKSNFRIQVVFETFWLEQTTAMGCLHDFLNVTDTSTGFQFDNSERICGRHEPFSWTSEGNSLLLRLHTDYSIAHTGYLASYTFLERPVYTTYCNKTHLGPNGVIQSPNIAQGLPLYENNQLCFYLIKGKVGENIVIDFIFFNVELQTPCERDYVKVEDVGTGKTSIICGQNQNLIWESESNEVNITFVTDSTHAFNGFNATYKMHALDRVSYCDVTLVDESGSFHSPSFPAKYSNNLDCDYTIIVDPHHIIQVTFEKFELEESPHCTNDYVELSSTGEGTSQRFCGKQHNVIKWNSTTNHAVVRLHTDHIVTKKGFLATYKTHLLTAPTVNCSRTLEGPVGMFSTPDYPSNYDNNLDCVYTISLNPNEQRVLRIEFLDFELEPPRLNFCSDFAQLTYTSQDLKLCGQLEQHIFITANHVVIHFHSDGSNTYRGFKAMYTSIAPPNTPTIVSATLPPHCDLEAGRLTESYGIIHSPNFPLYYPNNALCRTVIETKKNTHIVITIRFMDIENYKLCEWDSVQIFDDITGRSSEPLCGSLDAPFIWKSDSNQVTLIFKSDEILARTGYYGTYAAFENVEILPVTKPQRITKPQLVTKPRRVTQPRRITRKPEILNQPPEAVPTTKRPSIFNFGCFGNFC